MALSNLQERALIAGYRPFIEVVHQCLMNRVYEEFQSGNPAQNVQEMAKRAITQELTVAQQFAKVLVAIPAIQAALTVTVTNGSVTDFTIQDETTFSNTVVTAWILLYGIF